MGRHRNPFAGRKPPSARARKRTNTPTPRQRRRIIAELTAQAKRALAAKLKKKEEAQGGGNDEVARPLAAPPAAT